MNPHFPKRSLTDEPPFPNRRSQMNSITPQDPTLHSPTPTLDAALAYATAGYSVQWCHPRQKRPIADAWSSIPILSAAALTQTWRPRNNVSVRCGHWSVPQPGMGLVVLNIRHHPPGRTFGAL